MRHINFSLAAPNVVMGGTKLILKMFMCLFGQWDVSGPLGLSEKFAQTNVSPLFSVPKFRAPEAPRRGRTIFLLKIPGGGGSPGWVGGGPRGREGVCRELGGVVLNIFFGAERNWFRINYVMISASMVQVHRRSCFGAARADSCCGGL